ncbi:hypothetical protein, partial [Candidatus Hakubella thermalkaliphila]|uniref:hypothetical protein n=1 Tax=Candidatus Hakubella thermalkaliphila TaxID=2754717 RepID=UPI001C616913
MVGVGRGRLPGRYPRVASNKNLAQRSLDNILALCYNKLPKEFLLCLARGRELGRKDHSGSK